MIKYIIATIFLYGLLEAIPLHQRFTCPEDDCEISQCLYANPDNCNTFWQCSDGRAFLKKCPFILEWNDFIKVCDWPSDQTCRPGLQPTQRPTTGGVTETTTESFSSETTTEQTSDETTTESATQTSTEQPSDPETSSTEGTTDQTSATVTSTDMSATTELPSTLVIEEIAW